MTTLQDEMKSKHIETHELTDAELDSVSGGIDTFTAVACAAIFLSPAVAIGAGVAYAAYHLADQSK